MKHTITALFIAILILAMPRASYSWSKKGHELVAEIAFHYLDDSTKARVEKYLGGLSIESAANWMDDMRSKSSYDYMKTWHYINVEKGETYTPLATDRNILIILNSAIKELLHKDSLKAENIQMDLYLLFHLIGDLHQPLHVGYGVDRGGNDIHVSFLFKSRESNLHRVWDDDIIESKSISLEDCIKQHDAFTPDEIHSIENIKVKEWMMQSRSLLDSVYNFKNDFIIGAYVDNNAIIIEKQLFIAGTRLASVLREAFKR